MLMISFEDTQLFLQIAKYYIENSTTKQQTVKLRNYKLFSRLIVSPVYKTSLASTNKD